MKKMYSHKETSDLLSISEATVKNWIKCGYLKENDGMITYDSIDYVVKNVIGNEKLNSRANKTKIDKDNLEEISEWVDYNLKNNNLDTLINEYEKKLSNSTKNIEGIYYTPMSIVNDMLKDIEINEDSLFLDPSCGNGNFLIGAINKGIKPENIYGFDTDPNAVKIARERIKKKTGVEKINIYNGDFLEYVSNGKDLKKYDFIFTNPPWGKKMDNKYKKLYAKKFNVGNSKDTTSLFIGASLKLLKDNGTLGFLIQDAVFNVGSYEDLRKLLLKYNIIKLKNYGKSFFKIMNNAQSIILKNDNFENKNIICEYNNNSEVINKNNFEKNPKTIFNFWVNNDDIKIIDHFFNFDHITLKNNAKWGMGIVTGNNKKFLSDVAKDNYLPIWKSKDFKNNEIKEPTTFIYNDFNVMQQVAPLELYYAKEKIIYKFISSKLSFFHDTKQRLILNNLNFLIPNKGFPISQKQLCDYFNSEIINWLFSKIFNPRKILRSDIEEIPIIIKYFNESNYFDENRFLSFMGIKKVGTKYELY
jgi:site-specific DNA-methyltransferase (adenine-specific)